MHAAHALLESHRWMERGFLPRAGTWRDQEAWWLTAIEAVTAGVAQATATLRNARTDDGRD